MCVCVCRGVRGRGRRGGVGKDGEEFVMVRAGLDDGSARAPGGSAGVYLRDLREGRARGRRECRRGRRGGGGGVCVQGGRKGGRGSSGEGEDTLLEVGGGDCIVCVCVHVSVCVCMYKYMMDG